MSLHCPALHVPVKQDLPPSAPIPAVAQTLGCRIWPLGYLERCRARYGDSFTVYPVDMPPLVFLADPADIRALLSAAPTVLHAGAAGAVVAPLFGQNSFVLSEEEEHRCGRSALAPAFTRAAVDRHAAVIDDLVRDELSRWPARGRLPIHTYLRPLVMRIVLRVILGDGGSSQALHRHMMAMLEVMRSLVLQEHRLRHLPGWRGAWRRMLAQREAVDRIIFDLIRMRRRGGQDGGEVLGLLLAAHNPDGSRQSDRQIRDNLVSLLVAGHETTAAELAWAFQLLAHNQAPQDRLAAEISQAAGVRYMTATIHEVQRCRPVFLFASPRSVVRPIEVGGRLYVPPVQLLGCTYLVHHDQALYRAPHEFRPERFLESPPSPRNFLPWGGGRRRCLGQHLALLQMRAVLRAVLARWCVLPTSAGLERASWRTVLVAPRPGARVMLEPRVP